MKLFKIVFLLANIFHGSFLSHSQLFQTIYALSLLMRMRYFLTEGYVSVQNSIFTSQYFARLIYISFSPIIKAVKVFKIVLLLDITFQRTFISHSAHSSKQRPKN